MLCVETVIEERFPGLSVRQPLLSQTLRSFLKFLWHEREFQQFGEKYAHLEGFDFIEQVFTYFDFGYRVKNSDRERIPTSGRIVIVANHPIGTLDGLALLLLIGSVRPDVKVIANDFLYAIKPLRSLLLPVDNMRGRTGKERMRAIHQHLTNEGAVIIFPAGEVSRLGPSGIKDGHWNTGFLRFATNNNAPILPICIDGRNSVFFYSLSLLAKPISTLWLIREMFKQAKRDIDFYIGNTVSPAQYQSLNLNSGAVAKLFRKQVYRLPKKDLRHLGFASECEAIAHPENRQQIKKEIKACELLGHTNDHKEIVLYRYQTGSVVLREIGRLRELTFRAVKEGTGKRRDIDAYDHYYDHILLWDDQALEIVGAYRLVRTAEALREHKLATKLYTQTLFQFSPDFDQVLANGLELGRSFVQPQYWGKRAVDYLWYGIGAYLRKYPELRYLFGPVSISQDYSDTAKQSIVQFYMHYCAGPAGWATARNPYLLSISAEQQRAVDFRTAFCQLKEALKAQNLSVPTLYKQYTELCEPGGAVFLDFHIDKDFSDSLDGLILLDRTLIKAEKRLRYIGSEEIDSEAIGSKHISSE